MPKRKSLELFCTPRDLLSLFELVESPEALVYVQTGMFEEETPKLFKSGKDLPNLGVSNLGETSTEPSYLVLGAREPVNVRPVPQKHGGVLYAVDQLLNPDTVVLKPGGVYRDECVIAGQLATVSTTPASLELFAHFSKGIRRLFSKERSYWVGPEASDLWKKGARLTVGANVSRQFDLRSE